jgi:hypothetical protein
MAGAVMAVRFDYALYASITDRLAEIRLAFDAMSPDELEATWHWLRQLEAAIAQTATLAGRRVNRVQEVSK